MGFNSSPLGMFLTPDQDEAPDLEAWTADLAEQVETEIGGNPRTTASGSVNVTVSASVSGSATLVLPAGWDTAAKITVIAAAGSFDYNVGVGNVASGTPCTVVLAVKHINGTVTSDTVAVRWIARRTL